MARRLNSEGSIYRRKSDSRLCVAISTPQGRKVLYPKDDAEALEMLRQARIEVKQMTDSTLFGTYAGQWLYRQIDTKQLEQTTASWYDKKLTKYILPAIGFCPIQSITAQTISKFYAELSFNGLSPQNIKQIHAVISSCLSSCVPHIIENNPCRGVRIPKVKKKETEVITPWQIEILTYKLQRSTNPLKFLTFLLIETGCRIGELIGLKWQYVFNEYIEIREARKSIKGKAYNGQPKTASSVRRIYLRPETVAMINRLPKRSEYVFTLPDGRPHTYINAYRYITVKFKSALGKSYKPHSLRHLQATTLIQNGASIEDVRQRLGMGLDVLTRIYSAHTSDERQRNLVALLHKSATEEKTKAGKSKKSK